MATVFLITTIAFGSLFGYSLYVLKLLRVELKEKGKAMEIIKTYTGN